MSKRAALFTCLIAAAILAAGPAAAAWFLKLEKPTGETQTIELSDFNLGGQTPATLGRAPASPNLNEFTITKTSDAASPHFFRNCVAGAHYKQVVLEMRKAGGDPTTAGKPFLRYVLHDVVVTNVNPGNHSVKFSFGRFEVVNTPTPTPVVKPANVAPRK